MGTKLTEILVCLLCEEGLLTKDESKKVYKKIIHGGTDDDNSVYEIE